MTGASICPTDTSGAHHFSSLHLPEPDWSDNPLYRHLWGTSPLPSALAEEAEGGRDFNCPDVLDEHNRLLHHGESREDNVRP